MFSFILVAAPSTSGSELDHIFDTKSRSSSECPKKRTMIGGKRTRPWGTRKASSPNPTIKKPIKTTRRHGEAKWYIDTQSSNADTISISSSRSTPTLDRPTKKLGKYKMISLINY